MTERTAPQYDFYTTPPAGAATPPPTAAIPAQATPSSTSSAPSAPVYGAPVNQFGTPIGTPGATLPAAYAPAQQTSSGGVHVPRWVWRVVGPLVVLVVLGLFGVGRLGFLDVFHQDLTAPDTLAGMPRSEHQDLDLYRTQLESFDAPEGSYVIEGYESGQAFAFLGAFDIELTAPELLQVVNADAAPDGAVTVGSATCATQVVTGVPMTMCAEQPRRPHRPGRPRPGGRAHGVDHPDRGLDPLRLRRLSAGRRPPRAGPSR